METRKRKKNEWRIRNNKEEKETVYCVHEKGGGEGRRK